MSLTAIQYAWLYLIQNGEAGRMPSYYGGWDYREDVQIRFPKLNRWSCEADPVKDTFLVDIKNIGVNWDQTKEPHMDSFSRFEGTFCDPAQVEYMTGNLVLNDGTKQYWSAEKLEVASIFQMMAMAAEAETKFKEVFGR